MPDQLQLSTSPPRHRAIMRYLALGRTNREIAQLVGMTESRVSMIISSDVFRVAYAEFEDKLNAGLCDVRERFEELALPALDRLEHLMTNAQSEAVQRQAAMDILRGAGHGGSVRVDVSGAQPLMPTVQINVLLEALRESQAAATVVEARPVTELSA